MKSTLKRAIVTLAVIGLLVVVPSMRGTWTQLSKQGRRVWHDVGVGMGLIEEPQPVSVSVIIKPDGSCTTNGKEWAPPVAVKTQVYGNKQIVSGTIRIENIDQPMHDETPIAYCAVTAGGITCSVTDTTKTYAGAKPDGTMAVFDLAITAIDAGPTAPTAERVFIHGDGPYEFERDFSISTAAARLTRTESTSYGTGRSGKPVYAKEVSETDAWVTLDPPNTWQASFGSLEWAGEQAWNEMLPGWEPNIAWVAAVTMDWMMMSAKADKTFATIMLNWSDVPVDFSGRRTTFANGFELVGSGNSVAMRNTLGYDGDDEPMRRVIAGMPYLPDFSEFAVVDRVGTLIDTLRIDGGFKVDKRHAWTLPYGDPGTTIYPTVAEIRAIGQYSTPPGVTGLDYEDTDYEHQLWTPPLSFAINAASARAHKLI